jgi:hypothetical protein
MRLIDGTNDAAFIDPVLGCPEAIETQLATAVLGAHDPGCAPVIEREYFINGKFWRDVLVERLRSRAVVHLRKFTILEWFPRAPGLFHTRSGGESRRIAFHTQLDPATPGLPVPAPDDFMEIYSLRGKASMIDGGLGCLRLRDKMTADGRVWFMSASSNAVAHEGVPVGLPDAIYGQIIDQIAEYGSVLADVTGRLAFVPKGLTAAYRDSLGVPMLYLRVEQLRILSKPGEYLEIPVASAAVTFRKRKDPPVRPGTFDRPRFPTAYVTFTPGQHGNLWSRLDWLERYVREFCDGTIITDFDEHVSHFPDAVFALSRISTGQLDPVAIEAALQTHWWADRALAVNQIVIQELHMGDNFSNIGDNVIIINRSLLHNALNQLSQSAGEDAAEALKALVEHVQKSGNGEAAEHLEAFLEEVEREQPRRSRLSAFWDGLVKALPSVAQLGEASAKIAEILAR